MQTHFIPENFTITRHARERLEQRGFTIAMLHAVLRSPEKVYESRKFAGQLRVVGGEMCAAVDPVRMVIVTVFFDQKLDPNWKK